MTIKKKQAGGGSGAVSGSDSTYESRGISARISDVYAFATGDGPPGPEAYELLKRWRNEPWMREWLERTPDGAVREITDLQRENERLRHQVKALGGKVPAAKPKARMLRLDPELDLKLVRAAAGMRGGVSAFIRRAIRREISRGISNQKKTAPNVAGRGSQE